MSNRCKSAKAYHPGSWTLTSSFPWSSKTGLVFRCCIPVQLYWLLKCLWARGWIKLCLEFPRYSLAITASLQKLLLIVLWPRKERINGWYSRGLQDLAHSNKKTKLIPVVPLPSTPTPLPVLPSTSHHWICRHFRRPICISCVLPVSNEARWILLGVHPGVDRVAALAPFKHQMSGIVPFCAYLSLKSFLSAL